MATNSQPQRNISLIHRIISFFRANIFSANTSAEVKLISDSVSTREVKHSESPSNIIETIILDPLNDTNILRSTLAIPILDQPFEQIGSHTNSPSEEKGSFECNKCGLYYIYTEKTQTLITRIFESHKC